MSDTVYIVIDRYDSEIHSVFSHETDAEQYIKKNDPDGFYLTIEPWTVHNSLT